MVKTTIDLPAPLYHSMVRLAAECDVAVLKLIPRLLAKAAPHAREKSGEERKGKEDDGLIDWRSELL